MHAQCRSEMIVALRHSIRRLICRDALRTWRFAAALRENSAMISPHELPARDAGTGLITTVVELPRGSRNKWKFDPKSGLFRLGKVLPVGASFPFDFGFIPSTLGDDGDPLDMLILSSTPAITGGVVMVRLFGAIEAEQTAEGKIARNDRFLGASRDALQQAVAARYHGFRRHLARRTRHFFVSYNEAEGRTFKPLKDRALADEANEMIAAGEQSFRCSRARPRRHQPLIYLSEELPMKSATAWHTARPPLATKCKSGGRYDVIVVGGGITGLTTAYFLKQAGKKVCLLEGDRLASGDTALTTRTSPTSPIGDFRRRRNTSAKKGGEAGVGGRRRGDRSDRSDRQGTPDRLRVSSGAGL